ncbi:hypothetical protein [Streptomyces sp. XD-27]|uniref:hypothetical protein n=1 Tax=Streptomyces sp. XD-27 TaxID=3062779 RepID=UPI0026F40BC5|nr:hypothetical protein [Streptomyces sp. XD-27]WKX72266.1 hypothetical protein Q3Y56_22305 [Streptomyces sp. XD-27]
MNIKRRGARLFGAIALGVVPLALATPASAASHTATLTVGPVILPSVPVQVCLDSTCTPSTPLVNVTLKAEATTDTAVVLPTLTKSQCPSGQLGAALTITSTDAQATASVKVTATGLGTDGQQKTVVVGPKTVSVGAPGVVASACTTN